jgi:hypothetical protein
VQVEISSKLSHLLKNLGKFNNFLIFGVYGRNIPICEMSELSSESAPNKSEARLVISQAGMCNKNALKWSRRKMKRTRGGVSPMRKGLNR